MLTTIHLHLLPKKEPRYSKAHTLDNITEKITAHEVARGPVA